ncbi:hypothetical protein [Paraburkholderia diazotrophica]|uniref:hypothetical protein n=1 Tax=Paraburkholderia diazotrophica TaxID=667676 RepID=UPI00115FAB76|nr:hypothetical protein [Paraburkholderia diazotrophica]
MKALLLRAHFIQPSLKPKRATAVEGRGGHASTKLLTIRAPPNALSTGAIEEEQRSGELARIKPKKLSAPTTAKHKITHHRSTKLLTHKR